MRAWTPCAHACRPEIFHGFTLDVSGAPTPDSFGNLEHFGLRAQHMVEYETQHAGNDPRLAAVMRVAPYGVMLDHEHFSAQEALRNPVYADWLMPLGLKHTAGVVVRDEGSARDVLSFMRPRDAQPYSADDKRVIQQLMPDIARAARLRARANTLSRTASLGLAALDTLRQAVAVVDAQARIHLSNAAAEQLFNQLGPLLVRQGRLRCGDRPTQDRLEHLIRCTCASPPVAGALTVAEGAWRRGVSVLPLQASHAWASGQTVPMALVVVAVPGTGVKLDASLVSDVLGLSPAEVRLVLLLAAGKTVKDFAALEATSWHTARSHLRNAMRKTGCHRQSELVHLVRALQPV
ncbi:helix-turn-helix transcriptional regulator [Ottowia flava]|uniref:Helix-turn-helix transcriptional regulator n=1 Tax=Ottowia flava TaxID=2675430 RepID=A0ABW4L075_9BURK|nr:LuxR C-terminal-related transcriptional regulator [Ottowia sp. GY511]